MGLGAREVSHALFFIQVTLLKMSRNSVKMAELEEVTSGVRRPTVQLIKV
jgi:hypothetical protein